MYRGGGRSTHFSRPVPAHESDGKPGFGLESALTMTVITGITEHQAGRARPSNVQPKGLGSLG